MAPAVAEVAAVPEVVLDAELPVLARLLLPVVPRRLAVPALLEVVAEPEVEEVSVEEVHLLHRSFSAATAGNLPSMGTPRYLPVPRSGRKAKRRP